MSTPTRLQLRRTKGWRLPANAVSVARPGRWGNPFWVSRFRDAAACVALFEDSMRGGIQPSTAAHLPEAWRGRDEYERWRARLGAPPLELVRELRGKDLACWCRAGEPCHADVLLRLANAS